MSETPPSKSRRRPPAFARRLPRRHDPRDDPGEQSRRVGREVSVLAARPRRRGTAGHRPISSSPSSCSSSARRSPIRCANIATAHKSTVRVLANHSPHRTLIFLGWMPTLLLKTIAATHGANVRLKRSPHLRRPRPNCDRVLLHVAHRAELSDLRHKLTAQSLSCSAIGSCSRSCPIRTTTRQIYRTKATSPSSSTGVLVGDKHMYHGDPPTEPEGFLSTFPAIVTALHRLLERPFHPTPRRQLPHSRSSWRLAA